MDNNTVEDEASEIGAEGKENRTQNEPASTKHLKEVSVEPRKEPIEEKSAEK